MYDEYEIELQDIGKYLDDSYEVWDEDKNEWTTIKDRCYMENTGFPDPYLANEPITAIGIKYLNGDMVVFGCGDYETKGEEIYIKCKDEWTLCKKFLDLWQTKCPDIITGWNTQFFDIPYLINRFRKILGEDDVKKLSPWNYISERKVSVKGKQLISYSILGVASLDYIELYKWYSPSGKSQESYRLDNIAQVELGEGKISYDEYDNLHSLYRLNHQLFISYNIKDVELIVKLEDKLKLLELAITLAYDTKTNYEDVFAQTRMWDVLTYSYLLERDIIIPPHENKDKTEAFEGAYVKDVQIGLHNWVASFDLDSLHPHLMQQFNMSPETVIDVSDYTQEMRDIISQGVSVEKMLNKQIDTSSLTGLNVCLTPTGNFFRTDKQGFLPAMLESMYKDRKKYKGMMLDAKRELEKESDPIKRFEIEKQIARYNNIQLAKKLGLNSCFGVTGSQYFRFYDLRIAESVTVSSQLAIRWIANRTNDYINGILGTDSDYIIASDTDSIMVRLEELVGKFVKDTSDTRKVISIMDKICEDKFQPMISKSYLEFAEYVHAYAQRMNMKREALADKGIWTAKKRYIMNVYNNEGVEYKEPYVKVMGLEVVKSSTPAVIRGKMKEAINIMLRGTQEDIHKFINNFREEFKKLPAEDISFPRGVNGITKYSDSLTLYKLGTPIHVKGAILYNNYLNKNGLTKKYQLIQNGDKIKYAYLKMPNTFKDTVISFPNRLPSELGLDDYIDYDTQFNKSFLEPIKSILNSMKWTTEKVSTLDDFF
jgi:DNA polymerase elongation subunit (family B)